MLLVLCSFASNAQNNVWSWTIGMGLGYTNQLTYYVRPTKASYPQDGLTSGYTYGVFSKGLLVYPKCEFMDFPLAKSHSISYGFPTIVALSTATEQVYAPSGMYIEQTKLVAQVSIGAGIDINGGFLNRFGNSKLKNIGYFVGMGLGFSTASDSYSQQIPFDGFSNPPAGSSIYEYDYLQGPDFKSYERSASLGPYVHAGFMFRPPSFFRYLGVGPGNLLGLRWSKQIGLGSDVLKYNSISILWTTE